MRIQCEVCSATYTIDDAQLSDQPIGAQCPYCGHVKLVTRAGGAPPVPSPSVPPPGGAPSDVSGLSQLPPMPPPAPGGPGSGSLGPGNLPLGGYGPPPPDPGLSLPPSGPESDAARTLGFSEPPPGFAVQSVQPGPGEYSSASGQGFMEPPSPGFGGPSPDLDLPEEDSSPAACSVCGKPLDDEFDRVIGLCEAHQRDQRGEEPFSPVSADVPHDQWWVRPRHGGHPNGPYGLEDVRGRLRRGELVYSDQVSKDGRQFQSIERFPELAYLATLQNMPGPHARATGVSVHATPNLGAWARRLVVLAVLAGLGYGAWTQKDFLGRIYANLMQGRVSAAPVGLNPYRRDLEAWRAELGPPSGTFADLMEAGRVAHLEDSWTGYVQADRSFRQALTLRADDPEALGAFVENWVLWRYELASAEERNQAAQAIRFGLRIDASAPALHRAAAALALARSQLNVCQDHAERALDARPRDARARLLLAGCFLEGNVPLATEHAEQARALDRGLLRTDRILAEAHTRTGRFASARALLQARLDTERENALLHIAMGDLLREVSLSEEAEAAYRAAVKLDGYDQRAFVRMGDLQLELRRPGQAISALQGALESQEPHEERGARIFTGMARAQLLSGRPARAAQMADEALSFDSQHLPALILRGEAALLLDQLDVAVQVAERALKEGPSEPSALVLAGRAATRQGRFEVGRQYLEKAAKNDVRDPRLTGILAAHYLERGLTNQAYVLMRDAAEVDPEEAKARNRFTAVALSDAPVAEAIASFQASSRVPRNAPVAYAVMGLMYYFSGEAQRAYEAVRRSLQLDDANLVGLIYQAQLDLEAGRLVRGEQAIRRLLALERGFALGHVLMARIQAARGQTKEARESYRDALRNNPGFVAARVELAGLNMDSGSSDPQEELLRVFSFHPNSVRLRRLMLEVGL